MPDLIACPDPACTAPATIVDRWTFGSTNGPVEHVKTMCAWPLVHPDTCLARYQACSPAAGSAHGRLRTNPPRRQRAATAAARRN
jgi:hypothetical protein